MSKRLARTSALALLAEAAAVTRGAPAPAVG